MIVLLGNTATIDRGTVLSGNRITGANVPVGDHPTECTVDEGFRAITAPDGVWARQSGATSPAWVEASDPTFAQLLADHYGCPVGRPDDWETAQ